VPEAKKTQLYDNIFGKKVHALIQKQDSNLAPASINLKDFVGILWE
jgi:hypothetical protein